MFISCCSIFAMFVSNYHLKHIYGTGNTEKKQKKGENCSKKQVFPFDLCLHFKNCLN